MDIKSSLKRKDTTKLFFSKFPYSIKAKLPSSITCIENELYQQWTSYANQSNHISDMEKYSTFGAFKRYSIKQTKKRIRKFSDDIIQDNSKLFHENYETAYTKKSLIYYLTDETQLKGLINGPSSNLFSEFSCPSSDNAKSLLISNIGTNNVVRKSPFYNKYHYKITFTRRNSSQIDKTIENLCFGDDHYFSINDRERILYLSDKRDIVIIKLVLPQAIDVISECIISE